MSRVVLVARPVWSVLRRMGEALSAAGYAVEYAGSWDALLAERLAPERLAAVLLGEYGDVAAEEEILRRFRAKDGGMGVPVVVVGGQNAANRARSFRAAGADLVVAADLSPGEILDLARPLFSYGELYRGVEATARELRDQALVDTLTGLPNRRQFLRELERTVEMARRIGRPVSCIVSDIDGLRDVNESNGHTAGDSVIRQFGGLLARAKRSYDSVARLGGDEFGWLLVDAGPGQALQAARRAHRMVGEAVFNGGGATVRLTATFGVASILPHRALPPWFRGRRRRRTGRRGSGVGVSRGAPPRRSALALDGKGLSEGRLALSRRASPRRRALTPRRHGGRRGPALAAGGAAV